jgi:apolipoprotein N-acyltransferase
MIRARFLSGFPWNLLGVSQGKLVPLIQIASVAGVYGVSFLVAWFSTALLCACALFAAGGRAMRFAKLEVVVPLLVVVGILAWGLRIAVRPAAPASGTIKMALVQPSIPQRVIWDPGEGENRLAKLLELAERAMAAKPDLMVWPEGAIPGFPRWETNIHHAVINFARRHGIWLVLSGDDATPNAAREPGEYDEFNAAFLVSPEGEFVATYHKQRLVMFGEYIPLSGWFPFLTRWTGMGNFNAGTAPARFHAGPLGCSTSVLICFEDIFPHTARDYVEPDTDFLVNLTNDGWFGESAQQWQHAANAAFRAVENGVPLVRCANNGLTCWIDSHGRLRDSAGLEGTDSIYGMGFKTVEVPLMGGSRRAPTFYRQHGDLFGWGCVALTVLVLVSGWRAMSRRDK